MRGSLSVFSAGLTLVSAASHSSFRRERREPAGITKRYTTLTEQYATQALSSDYTLSLNLWGMYSGSGSQTAVATSVSGDSVGWETTWSWSGGESSVKSYSNIGLTSGLGEVTLAEISSIPTSWDWKVSGGASSATFDTSYDVWLSNSPSTTWADSSSSVELMVWTSGYGACTPAGSKVGTVTIAGLEWTYWKGTVQNWAIYSFVAPSPITAYDGDLYDFFAYLIKNEGLSTSQYLTAVQAGTEPFVGTDVTLTTTAYSAKVISGGEVISSTPASSLPSTTSKAASSSNTIKTGTTTTSKAPSATTSKAPSTTVAFSSSASASSGACGSAYSQCGGQGFSGSTCCPSGYTCLVNNAYYSQCRLESEASSAAAFTAVASSKTSSTTSSAPSSSSSVGSGSNLQTFSGAVNGISAPAVSTGGRGYLVADVTDGSSFYTLAEALSRSCDNQHNACAKAFNALPNGKATFTTADCNSQNTQCHASA